MVDLITLKDVAFLGLLVVAILVEGRRQLMIGIAAGVEGTINNLKNDGIIDVDSDGEITAKKSW